MTRFDRILLVAALSLAITGLLIAFVGAPLTTALFMRSTGGFGNSPEEFFSAAQRLNQCVQWMFFGGLGMTGLSLLYCFVLWATWFIGPRKKPE
jgi:hypothetical protein